jgi:uncharacterized protein with PIN domain
VSRPAVIVDTNVIVAGLLTGNTTSPVARILDGMLAAAFPFVVSEALLAEYRAVLARPALRKQHGLTVAEIDRLLTDIAQHAIVLTPGVGSPAPDAGCWTCSPPGQSCCSSPATRRCSAMPRCARACCHRRPLSKADAMALCEQGSHFGRAPPAQITCS